jgi:hypothetical protein
MEGVPRGARALVVANEGHTLFSVGDDGVVCRWDIASRKVGAQRALERAKNHRWLAERSVCSS